MNVNDISQDTIPSTDGQDRLDLMFKRQHELAIKYTPIEKANGLLLTEYFPGVLDDRKCQARMKDMAWRVTEELTEATEALVLHPNNPEHFIEEMIDSVHFFIELCLFCGYSVESIRKFFNATEGVDTLDHLLEVSNQTTNIENIKLFPMSLIIYTMILQPLGQAMNKLKNKPWKQSHMVTDVEAFEANMMAVWVGYVRVLCTVAELSPQNIFEFYFKKSEVNKFRMRSGY